MNNDNDNKIIEFPKTTITKPDQPNTSPVHFDNVFTKAWFEGFLTEQRKQHGFTSK